MGMWYFLVLVVNTSPPNHHPQKKKRKETSRILFDLTELIYIWDDVYIPFQMKKTITKARYVL